MKPSKQLTAAFKEGFLGALLLGFELARLALIWSIVFTLCYGIFKIAIWLGTVI